MSGRDRRKVHGWREWGELMEERKVNGGNGVNGWRRDRWMEEMG